VLLFGVLAQSGCGGVRTPKDQAVILIENQIRSLDPRFAVGSYDTKLSRLVAPGLMTVDAKDSVPRPLLARSVEREGPGQYLVTLRDDVRFPDGTPLTTEDVKYTFESTVDPDTHAVFRQAFADRGFSARALEVLSPTQMRIRLPQPVGPLLSDLEFGIVEKAVALRGGGKFPGGTVVGAGPFRIVRQTTDVVELAPNPGWPMPRPRLRKLVFKVVRDDGARLLALVGGSADLLQNSAGPSPLLLDTVLENPALTYQGARSATWTYLGMNCDDPLLADVRVRRAIAMAIDRDSIIAAKYGGRAVASSSMLPPAHWAFDRSAKRWPYDPKAARALLEEAHAVGKKLVIKTSASSRFRLALARVMASQLGEVGFDVEVRAYEFATFLGDVKRGNVQLFTLQLPEVTEPDFMFAFFHSSRVPTHDNPDAGANRFRYRDRELDAWLTAGRASEDRDERRRLYALAQERLAEQLPALPLWHEDNIAVMRREVNGYEVFPNARFSSLVGVSKQ
jgi:peptide/nickel transport system substrate-binding protein